MPSGATIISAAPAVRLVVAANFALAVNALSDPRRALPGFDLPKASAPALSILFDGSVAAPRATELALPTHPITGINAAPNVVMDSAVLPAVVSGVNPRKSLADSKPLVTALLVLVSAIESITAAPVSAMP